MPKPAIELGGLGHHLGAPGRIPDQVEGHARHTRHAASLGFDFGGQLFGRRTHRGGERHLDARGTGVVDAHPVDETQLVDVDGDLRVEDGLELFDDAFADLGHGAVGLDDAGLVDLPP